MLPVKFTCSLLLFIFFSLPAIATQGPIDCSKHLLEKRKLELLTQTAKEKQASNPKKSPATQLEQKLETNGIYQRKLDQGEIFDQSLRQFKEQENQDVTKNLVQKIQDSYQLRNKNGAKSIWVDFSNFPKKMMNFLEGPFYNRVGHAGLSEPFMDIRPLGQDVMWIHHFGDEVPMVIRWESDRAPDVSTLSVSEVLNDEMIKAIGKDHIKQFARLQVLTLPKNMTAKGAKTLGGNAMGHLEREVNMLISASWLNNYFEASSPIAKLSRIIHNTPMITDRPTQAEFREISQTLKSQTPEGELLRSNLGALLFVAPTGSGKTRILSINAEHTINHIQRNLLKNPKTKEKAIVVMANTADLINQLAKSIGNQLSLSLDMNSIRIVQWGGLQTEPGDLKKLLNFIDTSDRPVVLVTSSQTVASRIKTLDDMNLLFSRVSGLSIDEAHNATSPTFKRVLESARQQRQKRQDFFLLGTTATEMNRTQLTAGLFDYVYYGAKDKPGQFIHAVNNGYRRQGIASDRMIWITMMDQIRTAADKGEINAPEPIFLDNNVFARASRGTHSNVNPKKFYQLWNSEIESLVSLNGEGIIHCFPRDAGPISKIMSEKTGKLFLDITKLTPKRRDEAFNAFRKRQPYQGDMIYALVGPMREGLDFPYAGWMVVAKKYIGFPENIQAPGRTYRIAPGKVTPKVVFLSEEHNRHATAAIQNLVFTKTGRLPLRLSQGRGFTNSRRLNNESQLSQLSLDLNTAMNIFYRKNPAIAKAFADESPRVSPVTIQQFHDALMKERRRGGNKEIENILRSFFTEALSYKFYQGSMEATWNFADDLIKIKKLGKKPNSLGEFAVEIFNDQREFQRLQDFRTMKNWLGRNSREVVQNYPYELTGVHQLAQVLNSMTEKYGAEVIKLLNAQSGVHHLAPLFHQAIKTSPEGLYSKLSYQSRTILDEFFQTGRREGIEESINNYFHLSNSLPTRYFEKLQAGEMITITDKISHREYQRLQSHIYSGKLDINKLDPQVKAALAKSKILEDVVSQIIIEIRHMQAHYINEFGYSQYQQVQFNVHDLAKNQELGGSFRILTELAEDGFANAKRVLDDINEVLKSPMISNAL